MPRWYLYLCHLLVPVIFIGAAYLHYMDRLFLRWEFVVLLAVAALPLLLPLFARYVKGIGKDGIQFHPIFGAPVFVPPSGSAPSFDPDPMPTPPPTPTPTPTPVVPIKKFTEYSKPARKVLRTLWKFQKEQFGDDFSKRWGFGIHPLALDFREFESGSAELRKDGLIQDDPRGMIFLTDAGIIFCRDRNSAFDGGGPVWSNFNAA